MAKVTELIGGRDGARAIVYFLDNLSTLDGCEIAESVKALSDASLGAVRGATRELAERTTEVCLYKIFMELNAEVLGDKLTLTRRIKVLKGGKMLCENKTARHFEIIGGKYLKSVKNGKKQRFIPSRNAQNIKNNKKTRPKTRGKTESK